MTTQACLLDYSELSTGRWYRPIIGTDPSDIIDVLAGENRNCRDCVAPLREVEDVVETDSGYPAAILACDRCGWWCQYAIGSNSEGFFEWERVHAALRTYSVEGIEVPVAALRRELLKSSDLLAGLNPTKMEELVGSILSDFMDCEVVHTGRTGDGGIDLLLLDGDTPYAVQVKRRQTQRHGEAVSAIREFLGATLLAGHERGIYVTTATHYTAAALGAARRAKSLGLVRKLHLVDRDRFLRMLRLVSKRTLSGWQTFYGEEEDQYLKVRFCGENSPCEWVRYDESGNEIESLTSV